MDILRLPVTRKKDLMSLYRSVSKHLNKSGVHQWNWLYPNRFVIGADLKRGTVFGIEEQGQLIGAVVVDDQCSKRYNGLVWTDQGGKPACIHRLAVHTDWQGQGHGKRLLQFSEARACEQGATSIRLDVFTGNPGAVQMYRSAGYAEVGYVHFPMRRYPYLCMEKML